MFLIITNKFYVARVFDTLSRYMKNEISSESLEILFLNEKN